MEIKKVKVEAKDENSGFVNKIISTDIGDFENRKIAVSNFMYNCELDRLIYEKNIYPSNFQTLHISCDKRGDEWDYTGLLKSQEYAKKYNRIFLIYPQRNAQQLDKLTLEKSKENFEEISGLVKQVPFQLPLKLTLTKWKKVKKELLSLLDDNQELVPIISSKHDSREFPLIIKNEIGDSKIIGINSYEIRNITEISNLSHLREINRSIPIGENTSFFVNFGHPRILTRIANFPSPLGFSFFAGDVYSEKACFLQRMYHKVIKKMFNRKPKEYLMYDSKEMKYTNSPQQKGWYGEDITRKVLGGVSVNEGLDGYKVHKWVSQYLVQRDLDKITSLVFTKSDIEQHIKDYSGWATFLHEIKVPFISHQRKLPKQNNQY
jgi:hypothetical protein